MKPGATASSCAVTITRGMRKPGRLWTAFVHPGAASAGPAPANDPSTTPALSAPAMMRSRTPLVGRRRRVATRVLAAHGTRRADDLALAVQRLHLHERARVDRLRGLEAGPRHPPYDHLQPVARRPGPDAPRGHGSGAVPACVDA